MGGGSYTIKGIIETLNSWKNQKNISPPSQQGSIKEDYLKIPHQVYNLGLHLPFHLPFGISVLS